jgi:glutathione synthase/RimK-type ligase-like ATP-grasp enzyme
MKLCAFLSMDNIEDFECYDSLLDEPLKQLGWKTQTINWRDRQVDWNHFDAVLIRSPWDYQQDPDAFIATLKRIEQSSATLFNSLQTVLWNIDKRYLQEIEAQGVATVPTRWGEQLNPADLPATFEQFNCEEIIIKPVISANADNTFRLTRELAQQTCDKLCDTFSTRHFMLQPFMNSIIDEGEFSLFFFAGSYSHCILKTPADNDFRVQEEHGGSLLKVKPEVKLLQLAEKANRLLAPEPLYSRLDFVRSEHGFAIMEIELIEPSLYFNMDDQSALRFATAFNDRMNSLK